MTPEWEMLCRIDERTARVEERLAAHCEAEERSYLRRQGLAPWFSLAIAAAAFLTAVAAAFGR
jgi:hypothetical protein